MKITVGIVTKNRNKSLEETLKSIAGQMIKPYEVVIVENNIRKSIDLSKLKYRHGLSLRYFLVKKIPGITYSRNKVLVEARGDIIVFVDDDCVVSKNFIINTINSYTSDKNLVAIVGRSENFYTRNIFASLEQSIYEKWLSQYLNINKVSRLYSGVFVNTRNFSLKKKLIKLGLRFDPKAPFKFEDTDFGVRMFKLIDPLNQKVIYNHKISISHKNSTDYFNFTKRRILSMVGERWLNYRYSNFEPTAVNSIKKLTLALRFYFYVERRLVFFYLGLKSFFKYEK